MEDFYCNHKVFLQWYLCMHTLGKYHRRAATQSLLGQDEEATPLRKREQSMNYDGNGYSSTGSQGRCSKRVKLESYDEDGEGGDSKEQNEDNVSAIPKPGSTSKSLRTTKQRR